MASTDRIDGQPSRGAELMDRLTRGLAASVLVASILPVVLLGPSLLRAPVKLGRELHADVQRLLAHRRVVVHARPVGHTPVGSPTRAIDHKPAVGHGVTQPRAGAGHLTPRARGAGRR
jgi:hypothetical protein